MACNKRYFGTTCAYRLLHGGFSVRWLELLQGGIGCEPGKLKKVGGLSLRFRRPVPEEKHDAFLGELGCAVFSTSVDGGQHVWLYFHGLVVRGHQFLPAEPYGVLFCRVFVGLVGDAKPPYSSLRGNPYHELLRSEDKIIGYRDK